MKGLNGFMVVMAVLLLIVLGGGMLAHNFGAIDIGELVFNYAASIWAVLAGAAMLLLGVMAAVLNFTAKRPERSFSVHTDDGEIRITFGAIEDMLKKSTSRIDGIEDIRPVVVEGKGGIEVVSRVSVHEDVSIPEITARLNDVIKSQIRNVLGIEELGAVRTHIYRIAQKSKAKPAAGKEDKKTF